MTLARPVAGEFVTPAQTKIAVAGGGWRVAGWVLSNAYRSRVACTALVRRAKVSSSSWPTRSPIQAR